MMGLLWVNQQPAATVTTTATGQHWERVRRSRWDQPARGYLPDQSNAYWSTLNPIFLLNYVIIASLMLHGWSCADSRSQPPIRTPPAVRSKLARLLTPPKGNLFLSLFFLRRRISHTERDISVLVLSSEHQLPNRSLQSQQPVCATKMLAHARTMTQVIIFFWIKTQVIIELIMLTRRWSKPLYQY